MTLPVLSVVIIGRNEGERLRRCLQSVARAGRPELPMEVIYVDSGSLDGSPQLARDLGAELIELHPDRPTAALGRNAGWRAAQGEFVLFLDGDTVLDPGFLPEALPRFGNPAVAVVWGHRRELFPQQSVYIRVLDLDWIYPPGPAAFCGGDALFRREMLLATGGFDQTLIAGEEPELCRRILERGGTILHADLAMTGHDLAVHRFRAYWRRATRAGHAYAEVSRRFAGTGRPFWEEESRANRTRALTLLGAAALALAGSLLLRSFWPLLLWFCAIASLVVRTAWKARWKSRSWTTLLLYGLHSHLQQIPIWWGQLRFARLARKGVRANLVEYKG